MHNIVCRAVLALLLTAVAVDDARAQTLTRPSKKWETIETPGFRIHFPAEMRVWVMPVAARLESYAAAVNRLVGHKPEARVTVMVEDPANISNGFAVPLLEEPIIFLFPTPPSPSPSFGQHRGWGEILAVHEYAHIAHLTFPTRNPGERLLWKFLPSRVGPVARKAPPWVFEGYATFIEGRLTGNGRPNSVGRAAVLRQWALEGRLPTYGQLNSVSPFQGGAMRYLVGSAFLEWLVERKGEESLNHLWRRMSARQRRSFADAFRGVYGAGPDDLYGVFYTEVIGKAIEARRQIATGGLGDGELVQRLDWGTGEPALSRDGSEVAVVLRSPTAPSRLVVWKTATPPNDSARLRARRQMLDRDPQDVAPFDSFPPPRKAVATLYASGGRGHEYPRWFADGARLLVSRDEPLGDGATRPDLFIWNRKDGGLRRVTRGAGIRSADPSPDGTRAAGVRCANGICDLVLIDLARGSWSTLAPGSPSVVWHRARWSPNGRQVAAAVQRDGRWRAAVIDVSPATVREIDVPDSAGRYAPSWTRDGKLVVVSERGGVANLELLDAESGGATLTRVTGSVAAPDVAPDGSIWFLNLHAKGYDIRRLAPGADRSVADRPGAIRSAATRVVQLDPRLFPAAPRASAPGQSFAPTPIKGPFDYGNGSRRWRALPGGTVGPDGDMLSLMVANIDPVGRLSIVAQGGYGNRGAWRGGSLATALRSFPVQLDASAWYTEHAPSEQSAGSFASLDIDSRFAGGSLGARVERDGGAWHYAARVGGTAGSVDGNQLDDAGRVAGWAELRSGLRWTWRGFGITPEVSGHAAQGSTSGDNWTRTLVTGAFSLGGRRRWIRGEATFGRVTEAEPGAFGTAFEQFVVGGAAPPFFDRAVLSQRIALPPVPVGYASGRRLEIYRASTSVSGVEPYAMWVAAGDSITRYQRVFGVERQIDIETTGFVRVPGTRVRVGVGYALDEPYVERIRPYVSVTYRP